MKKSVISLLICILLVWITGTSYGITNLYEVEMKNSKTECFRGDTIQIPVKIKNIDVENGIVAYSTLLSYDETIWEKPEILAGENWQEPNVIEHLIQGTTISMQAVENNQEIMTISFKVKEDAKIGKTKIELAKFEVTNGETTIENEGDSIEINITTPQTKATEVIIKNVWFTTRNITIAAIISAVTLFIIVLIIIYYMQHAKEEEKSNLLYEEVKGIQEESKTEENKEE